jgi:hypothetical protein
MHTHETELERAARIRAREAAKTSGAPASELVELASAVGNQAFGQAITREATSTLRRAPRVRATTSTALIARNGDEEDPGLDAGQKARMKAMCVTPIRSASGKLAAGEKADVRSVIRHLRPALAALNGFSAKGATRQTILSAADHLNFNITALDSLALNDKQVIFLARTAWQTARRQIAATRRQLRAPTGASPEEVAKIEEGRAHLDALSQQVAATIRDLVETPRTKEGFQEVGDTAVQVIEQFDSFSVEGGTIPPSFVAARKSMFDGIGRIAPLALGKEQLLKEIEDSLASIANDLAGISDGEVIDPEPEEGEEEPAEEEPGDEEEEESEEPDVAPSPNPLPPPPPPPVPVP